MAELDLTQMRKDVDANKRKCEDDMIAEKDARTAGDRRLEEMIGELTSSITGGDSSIGQQLIDEREARILADQGIISNYEEADRALSVAIATKLDKYAFDSYKREAETVHVRNMEMPNYWAHSDGGVSYQLLKYGKVVVLEGTLVSTANRTAATKNGDNWTFTKIATGDVPDGFKPMKAARVVCQMSGSQQCKMSIDTSGVVTIDHIYDTNGIVQVLPKGSYIWIHAVWLTN